jgi:two-component system, OmpR family, phosphate regulon sensor histidine kinase PhoR
MARSISRGAGTLTRVEVVIVALVLALGVACILLAHRERERRDALAALGGAEGGLAAAARRIVRERVPRDDLSDALALRDALLAAAPYPVLLFDGAGVLVRANPSARRLMPAMQTGSPPEPPALATAIRDALSGRATRTADITVYQPERKRYTAHLRTFSTRDGHGCAVVLAEESAEADFRDARSLFSAGVSHELRTPLARMLALADTLGLQLGPDEHDAMLDQMRDEIDGMRRLIEEMVLLVRLETGEQAGTDERCDVTDAIARCVERQLERAERAGVSLAGDAPGGLVAAIAPPLVDAMLDNLAGNAIRHAGAGADVRISARGLTGAVEIQVADTGLGIPADHLPHVFERFYRVEGSRTGPGTGLGLAIVKHVAEAHGGRAEIESAEGRGTTVRVVLASPAAVRSGLPG